MVRSETRLASGEGCDVAKDARGHGSDAKGGQRVAQAYRAAHPLPAHQGAVALIGKAAKIGGMLYAAQAGAGVAGGVGWALATHTAAGQALLHSLGY